MTLSGWGKAYLTEQFQRIHYRFLDSALNSLTLANEVWSRIGSSVFGCLCDVCMCTHLCISTCMSMSVQARVERCFSWSLTILVCKEIIFQLYRYVNNKYDGVWHRQEIGGGTSRRQKGFWDRAGRGSLAWEDVMRQTQGTWAQVTSHVAECRLK